MSSEWPHLFLKEKPEAFSFVPVGGGNQKAQGARDRATHGGRLKRRLEDINAHAERQKEEAEASDVDLPVDGFYLEIEGWPGEELQLKSLEDRKKKISLSNVKTWFNEEGESVVSATVFVPEEGKSWLLKKIEAYLSERGAGGEPKNKWLVNSIAEFQLGGFENLWVGSTDELPGETPAWCEVWLIGAMLEDLRYFREICRELKIRVLVKGDVIRAIRFPDRLVVS